MTTSHYFWKSIYIRAGEIKPEFKLLCELFADETEHCLWWLEDHCGVTDLRDLSAEHVSNLHKYLSEELFTNRNDFRTVLDLNTHIITLNEICMAAGIDIVFAIVPFPKASGE